MVEEEQHWENVQYVVMFIARVKPCLKLMIHLLKIKFMHYCLRNRSVYNRLLQHIAVLVNPFTGSFLDGFIGPFCATTVCVKLYKVLGIHKPYVVTKDCKLADYQAHMSWYHAGRIHHLKSPPSPDIQWLMQGPLGCDLFLFNTPAQQLAI